MRLWVGYRMGSITVRAAVCAAAWVIGAAACTDPAAPSSVPASLDIDGTWASTDLTFTFRSSGDSISGVAVCNIVAACSGITDGSPIHGTLDGPSLQVTFELDPGTGSFAGQVASTVMIPGMLMLNGAASSDTLRKITSTPSQ
jgi:hypothetical protein